MAKVVPYIATSLDGYIARRDDGIDWLSMVEREGEDHGYAAFYESIDAIVSGSRTYELALGFGGMRVRPDVAVTPPARGYRRPRKMIPRSTMRAGNVRSPVDITDNPLHTSAIPRFDRPGPML